MKLAKTIKKLAVWPLAVADPFVGGMASGDEQNVPLPVAVIILLLELCVLVLLALMLWSWID